MNTAARRLRIANRMCLILQRELGVTVDVARVLRHRDQAAEVVFACRGLGGAELMALADQFEADTAAEETARLAARAPDSEIALPSWAQDSAGFDELHREHAEPVVRGLFARLFSRGPLTLH